MIHAYTSEQKRRPNILVIMGSVRANRLCPQIAAWVIDIARAETSFHSELVDLIDWPLPMNDEPDIPAAGAYQQVSTRAWSEKIAGADAVVFVAPQYNWGYPAVLKNAIDHLYSEWRNKPLVIVTYGGHGGGKCAAQLKQVAEGLKMRIIATMPGITLPRSTIEGAPLDMVADIHHQDGSLKQALLELEAELDDSFLQDS
ncbi:NADPH-dependent FMN reductase [Phyllobacterium sp. 22229]|uniref:NADPH-dependent FMN reductase n=1 Tax=Phyllobacterium sp. 22229 TaxID=3453895 RepID=UPI003F85B000